ncbi:MAG TPA: hypothetical protein VND91_07365 [Candidatus Saccharimonadia bacterium]|nr:hypothetical protein [Candidatus Saccharimonadia bacterium]
MNRFVRSAGVLPMRSMAAWRRALLGFALVAFVPTAMAATLSIARFVPRLELAAMFDIDRASPAGTNGSRAAGERPGEVPRATDEEVDAAGKDAATTAPADARVKPGAAGQQRAPRWKSLIPGALK